MPTLFRFLAVVIVLALIAGAAVIYLGVFVGPHTREMTVRIPQAKLQPQTQTQTPPQSPAQPQAGP
jgi:FlaG/FlaF family flagellin (archaellin)